MTPLPHFDEHFADGLAIIEIEDHIALYLDSNPRPQNHAIQDKLTRAQADLARLRQGWRPSPADLVNAPSLSHWSFQTAITGQTILFGIVNGHPRIRDGAWCNTSMLIAIDTQNWKWARTWSRFYNISKKK